MGLLEKHLGGTLLLHTDDRACGDNGISVNMDRSALKVRGDTNSWIVLNLIHSLHILLVWLRILEEPLMIHLKLGELLLVLRYELKLLLLELVSIKLTLGECV